MTDDDIDDARAQRRIHAALAAGDHDEAERIAREETAKQQARLMLRRAEDLSLPPALRDALSSYRAQGRVSTPLRDLYIARYGSEAAADARLAEEARQGAIQDAERRRSSPSPVATHVPGAATVAEPAELSTRERDTLLKLVIGMAVAGYSYAPDAARSGTPSEIVSDLAKLGIELTDDTVRKWLKEAAKLLPGKAA